MREIKFRGKDLKTGEWRYGDLVGYSEAMSYIYGDYVDANEIWQVDTSTIGQYTGLKDKNGVEIYEGDVLEFNEELYTAVWDEEDAMFSISNHSIIYDFGQFYNHEVLIYGNIYENPELLENSEN